jgi:hypothetical protein
MDIPQKNNLLKIFLSQFFGIGQLAESYAIENNMDNYREIINEFENIRDNIFGYIWEITESGKQLTQYEIETICASYCFEHYQ